MIKRFTDHAANERTYLAWIRTSIAIMALGFLVEKFNLFITYIGEIMGNSERFHSSASAEIVGFILLILSIAITIASTIRFLTYKKNIDSEAVEKYGAPLPNLVLGILLTFLGIFLVAYLGHRLVSQYFGYV